MKYKVSGLVINVGYSSEGIHQVIHVNIIVPFQNLKELIENTIATMKSNRDLQVRKIFIELSKLVDNAISIRVHANQGDTLAYLFHDIINLKIIEKIEK